MDDTLVAYAFLNDFCLDKGCSMSFLDDFFVKFQEMEIRYDFKTSKLMGRKHKSIIEELNKKFNRSPPRKEHLSIPNSVPNTSLTIPIVTFNFKNQLINHLQSKVYHDLDNLVVNNNNPFAKYTSHDGNKYTKILDGD